MAAALEAKLSPYECRVWRGRFEEWPADPQVDMVVAATSLHWVELETAADRLAAALRPGGLLAPFWVRFASLPRYEQALNRIYERSTHGDRPRNHTVNVLSALSDSGRFTALPSHEFTEERPYAADGWVRLVGTFSETLAMSSGERSWFLGAIREVIDREFGGIIIKRLIVTLHPFRVAAASLR